MGMDSAWFKELYEPVVEVTCIGCGFEECHVRSDKRRIVAKQPFALDMTNKKFSSRQDLCKHILENVNPTVLYSLTVCFNSPDHISTETTVYIGDHPATCKYHLPTFENLSQLIEAIVHEYTDKQLKPYLLKEYSDSTKPDAKEKQDTTALMWGRYAEKFLQSGKDLVKVIQSSTPDFIRRPSTAQDEDRVLKDGLLCVVLGLKESAEGCLKRLKRFSELHVLLHGTPNRRISVGANQSGSLRILGLCGLLGDTHKVDWGDIMRIAHSQPLALQLAVYLCSDPIVDRHHRSCVLLAHPSDQKVFNQKPRSCKLKMPSLINVCPHELVTIDFGSDVHIKRIESADPSVRVQSFEQVGCECSMSCQVHLYQSRPVVFACEWGTCAEVVVHFNVDLYAHPLTFYKQQDSLMVHLRSPLAPPFTVHVSSPQKEHRCSVEDSGSREYLFHVPFGDVCQVSVKSAEGRQLLWTEEYLPYPILL